MPKLDWHRMKIHQGTEMTKLGRVRLCLLLMPRGLVPERSSLVSCHPTAWRCTYNLLAGRERTRRMLYPLEAIPGLPAPNVNVAVLGPTKLGSVPNNTPVARLTGVTIRCGQLPCEEKPGRYEAQHILIFSLNLQGISLYAFGNTRRRLNDKHKTRLKGEEEKRTSSVC